MLSSARTPAPLQWLAGPDLQILSIGKSCHVIYNACGAIVNVTKDKDCVKNVLPIYYNDFVTKN